MHSCENRRDDAQLASPSNRRHGTAYPIVYHSILSQPLPVFRAAAVFFGSSVFVRPFRA